MVSFNLKSPKVATYELELFQDNSGKYKCIEKEVVGYVLFPARDNIERVNYQKLWGAMQLNLQDKYSDSEALLQIESSQNLSNPEYWVKATTLLFPDIRIQAHLSILYQEEWGNFYIGHVSSHPPKILQADCPYKFVFL